MPRQVAATPTSQCRGRRTCQQKCTDRVGHALRRHILRTSADGKGNLRQGRKREKEKEVSPQQLQQTAGDGETVTPSLPEPGVWTGMASANVSGALRWKRAKTHRGSRRKTVKPHQEAGYTSAVVTIDLDPANLLQSGGVHIRPHMTAPGQFLWR